MYEMAQLAAFIDGEGCITVLVRQRKKRSSEYRVYQPHVVITNTDKRLMDWLMANFGGWVSKRQPKRLNSKVIYLWHMNNVKDLLYNVYPYLLLKREQAKILMEFPVSRAANKNRTEEDKRKQEQAYQRVRELNA